MILRRVSLHHFRNISSLVIDVSPTLTIVVGENAHGKTNILEAVYCLVTGEGFRESKEEELIQMGESSLQVDGLFVQNDVDRQFRIFIQKENGGLASKTYFLEKARKSHKLYLLEQTKAVLFAPEQIEIITGAPSLRRTYFDRVIGSFDYSYKVHISNYDQALRKRNKVLEQYRGGNIQEELAFWDAYLVTEGSYLTKVRSDYINFLNGHPHLDGRLFEIEYVKNEFSLARLSEKRELELRIHKTLIGPQKDEFIISLKDEKGEGKNIQTYGSRSEQRLGVFWLKMNEIHYMEKELHIRPILLLDDVFSEFDHENKERILRLIQTYQTVMTTTEEELVREIEKKEKEIRVVHI